MSSCTRRPLLVSVTAALCLALGCQKNLPPAGPLDAVVPSGIYIYEDVDYSGESAHVTTDLKNLGDYNGPCPKYDYSAASSTSVKYGWQDCISSIKVAPGWQATVYVDTDFRGAALELTADMPNLTQVAGTWNDCISSIRVRRQ